jgi:hypothetical protein
MPSREKSSEIRMSHVTSVEGVFRVMSVSPFSVFGVGPRELKTSRLASARVFRQIVGVKERACSTDGRA